MEPEKPLAEMSFEEATREYKKEFEKAEMLVELMEINKGNHIEFDRVYKEMNESKERMTAIIEYIRIIAGTRSVEGKSVKDMADQVHRMIKNSNGPRLIKRKRR